MSEHHEIIGEARGEPRAVDCVGVRVRVRLSGCLSRRWSQALAGRLASELAGHTAVGHLRININEIVQGDQIVLEGVESSQATVLAQPLQRAVDGANQAATREPNRNWNVTQREADAIAGQISVHEP